MNKEAVVLYKSKYGHTKKYADWIAKELGCAVYEIDKFDFGPEFKTVIFGGGLYAGQVNGIKQLVKNFEKIKDKNIVVFTVGLADPSDEKAAEHIKKSVKSQVPEEMYSKMKLHLLRGGIDYKKLTPVHRAMMWMLKNMLAKKPANKRSESDNGIIDTYGTSISFLEKNAIKEISEV